MINLDTNKEQLEHVLQSISDKKTLYQNHIKQIHKEVLKKKNEINDLEENHQFDQLHFSPRKSDKDNKLVISQIQGEIQCLSEELDRYKKMLQEEETNSLYLDNIYFSLFHNHFIQIPIKKNDFKQEAVLQIKEEERARIATDLHDTVVQDLVYLTHQTELVQKYMQKDVNGVMLEIADMKKNIKNIIEQIREKIYNLRPMSFDDLGWDITFQRLEETIRNDNNLQVLFQIDKPSKLSKYKQITIYRIIRECCINVIKHAQASIIEVKLNIDDKDIMISIMDNGIGIKNQNLLNQKNHFGMREVKENVLLLSGQMNIQSEENKGTKITIHLPYLQEDDINND